jgi:pimeloyl-ACP methyl ester carboxylesterase
MAMKKAALQSFNAFMIALGLVIAFPPGAAWPGPAQLTVANPVVTTDHAVPHISTVPANAGTPVNLFVREHDGTRPNHPRKPVLMLHGRSVPALAAFDFGTGRFNWSMDLARAGFDVFIMDLQGIGRSPRPTMDDPCNADPAQQGILIPNPLSATCPASYPHQLNNSQSDWDEVDTVVDFIRSLRHVQKIDLIGYSAAAFQFGPYTIQHPDKVSSLFLLAPIFPPDGRPSAPATLPVSIPPDQFGFPMRIQTRAEFQAAWDSEIHCADQRPTGMVDVVWNAIMDNDTLGRTWGPPSGVLRFRNAFTWGWTRSTVQQESVLGTTVPVFIVYGDLDTTANTPIPTLPVLTFSVPKLYDAIPGTRKLMFRLACTGHSMPWENQALELHDLSKQWLRQQAVDGLTNGSFFMDEEGNLAAV